MPVTYEYDQDGFLTTRIQGSEVTQYTYSSLGELLHVDLPDTRQIDNVYDALGHRVAKKVDGTTVATYLWAGPTTLLAVYETGQPAVRFEYADGRMPFAMVKDGARYYLAYNQVGSLRAVFDATGALVKTIDYDSFGNVLTDTNSAFHVPFGFAGGLYDPDTHLVLFGARDYDPDTGRWTAKDPIGFENGDTDLYGYCVHDPVNIIDPLGLSWDTFLGAAANFSAGAGDYISFGLTRRFRKWQMGEDVVNYCSGWYKGGRYTAIAADIGFGIGGLSGGGLKLFGSHTAGATRKWLGKQGYATYGEIMHHWAIPRNRWGRFVPGIIKNRPWNYMRVANRTFHDAIEGKGIAKMGLSGRLWYGTPLRVKGWTAYGLAREYKILTAD